jgi:hypothetical protein
VRGNYAEEFRTAVEGKKASPPVPAKDDATVAEVRKDVEVVMHKAILPLRRVYVPEVTDVE